MVTYGEIWNLRRDEMIHLEKTHVLDLPNHILALWMTSNDIKAYIYRVLSLHQQIHKSLHILTWFNSQKCICQCIESINTNICQNICICCVRTYVSMCHNQCTLRLRCPIFLGSFEKNVFFHSFWCFWCVLGKKGSCYYEGLVWYIYTQYNIYYSNGRSQ